MATVAATAFQDALQDVRERTLALVAPFSHAELERVQHPLMSPLDWDLGHIAAYEDLWLVHRHGGEPLLRGDLADALRRLRDPARRPRRHPVPARRRRVRLPRRGARAHAGGPRACRPGRRDAVRDGRPPRGPAQRDDAPDAVSRRPAGRPSDRCGGSGRRGRRVDRDPRRGLRDGRPRRQGFAFDNERPRHARRGARVRDRPAARDQRDVDALRRGRRLRAARVVVGRGLGVEGGVRHLAPRRLDGGRGGR